MLPGYKNIARVLISGSFLVQIAIAAYGQWIPCTRTPGDSSIVGLAHNEVSLFAASSLNGIIRTDDFGITWTVADTGLSSITLAGIVSPLDYLVVSTTTAGFFYSDDDGNQWIPFNEGVTNLMITSLADFGDHIYAGSDSGRLFVLPPYGDAWFERNIPITDDPVKAVLKLDQKLIAGTFHDFFYSNDDGLNWRYGSSGMITNELLTMYGANHQIFAGTRYGGIFSSNDYGITWEEMNHGLTSLYIPCITGIDSVIFAATIGAGVYYSTDCGSSWKPANEGLNASNINMISVFPPYLIAGSDTNGIWKRPLSDFGLNGMDHFSKGRWTVYPNPSDGVMVISDSEKATIPCSIDIFDLAGKTLFNRYVIPDPSGKTFLQLPLKPGSYLMKIRSTGRTLSIPLMILR